MAGERAQLRQGLPSRHATHEGPAQGLRQAARYRLGVGLDFGGTSIKGGAITAAGRVLEERSIPLHGERGAASVLDEAAELARALGAARSGALGVGVAGLLDRSRGLLAESPNLAFLRGLAIGAELAERLGLRSASVRLENDANAAALGEQWLGAAKGLSDVLVVTLGTGIGGGAILAGRLYTGGGGRAGEIGHVVIDPAGPPCACGARGCSETLASAAATARRARERGLPRERPGDVERLVARAREGGAPEARLLTEVGRDLGRALAAAVTLLDLEHVIFAGGFSAALDVLEEGIRAGLEERCFGRRDVRLSRAALGPAAGWIGAARLVLAP